MATCAKIMLTVFTMHLVCGDIAAQQVRAVRLKPAKEAPPEPQRTAADAAPQKEVAEAAEDNEATKEKGKKQARLAKFQKLVFDRRASTILKTWAEIDQASSEENKPNDNGPKKPADDEAAADPLDRELAAFQRDVTLGRWERVKQFLAELPEDESKALYTRLLQALQRPFQLSKAGMSPEQIAQMLMQQQQQGRRVEAHSFALEDVLLLAAARPQELDDAAIVILGQLLRATLDKGNVIEKLVERLREETGQQEGIVNRRQAAKLLMAAGRILEAGEFLPEVKQAKADGDFDGLNMLSRYYLQQHSEEEKPEFLEQAWDVVQAVLAADETEKAQKDQALKRAVDIAPKIREELGTAWLNESFTQRPERGMEILASIGSANARGLQQYASSPKTRLRTLKLQTTAVEALLQAAPERAEDWKVTLDLLARNWLEEAKVTYRYDTSTSRGPSLRRDRFGNFFYYDEENDPRRRMTTNRVTPIKTSDMIDIKPSDDWLAYVSDALQPKFDMLSAQLFLKVSEEDQAFPYIENLAAVYPELAKDLVAEFLRVWTNNHDPNATRNRTNYYMYMYGYERKAESIPLTRSKQQRNLEELAALVKRLKKFPVEIDESQIARAFTTCHSQAEVYQLAAIERVFGAMDDLEPKTLAELAQQMRANLVSVWRAPAVQKDKKTNRKQKDIEAEVKRGYSVAQAVVTKALKQHPDDWTLLLAKASLDHDENSYLRELGNDSKFSQRQQRSFDDFEKAIAAYAAAVADTSEDEWTTKPFEIWYYASLGACDLNQVTDEKVPDLRQPAKIREAILQLPEQAVEKHMDQFANTLFTRMSSVKPAVKFRYVRSGLDIVGDNPQAIEARQVYDYYQDLVTEIKLETVIDGSSTVSHEEPFGIYVHIRHTKEIERESNGFGRYLQNQNSNYFYYNYGRPLANYRDKFEEIVNQAFEEHFEVQSVTFQKETVNSRAVADDYGWRITPYAYLLVKPRGPEVDKIPSVRLDLDFLDTSGYAVIPIESPPLPIDAATEKHDIRPVKNIALTQTLDERQADEGKLILEVKAVSQGLVPDLEELLDFAPQGFEIVQVEDDGVSVSRFDEDADDNVIVSERLWMVNMQAKGDLQELPETFTFGSPKLDVKEAVYQRYNDADLASVEPTIALEQTYGTVDHTGKIVLAVGAGLLALVLGGVGLVVWRRRKPEQTQVDLQMPDELNAFSVLGLLKRIEDNNGFSQERQVELSHSINRIEAFYFDQSTGDEPDLREIAEHWLTRKAR
ncbi:MAG TPA: hypothetical protein DCY79_16570 [Planctomycetaceae bacterium]|nr:hypothetical protein [Planctomycetaceae bacterium]